MGEKEEIIYKDIWMEEEAEEEEQEKAGEGSKAIQKEEGDPGGDTEEVKEMGAFYHLITYCRPSYLF